MKTKRRRKPGPKNTATPLTNNGSNLTKSVSFEFELDIDDEGDDYAVVYARKQSDSDEDNHPVVMSNIPGVGDELEIFHGTIEEAKSVFERIGENVDIHDFCSLLHIR